MFMSTSDYELIGRSARGLENWRSTPGQPEERENGVNAAEKAPPPPIQPPFSSPIFKKRGEIPTLSLLDHRDVHNRR